MTPYTSLQHDNIIVIHLLGELPSHKVCTGKEISYNFYHGDSAKLNYEKLSFKI